MPKADIATVLSYDSCTARAPRTFECQARQNEAVEVVWRLQVSQNANPRSLANFPMQANGAEMLRLACCLGTEQGVEICAPIHDAVLICAPLDQLNDDVLRMQRAMADASRIVLDGFELGTDAKIVRHPDRYMDERGILMWDRVMKLIDEQQRKAAE